MSNLKLSLKNENELTVLECIAEVDSKRFQDCIRIDRIV